jgi:hypothetical protein
VKRFFLTLFSLSYFIVIYLAKEHIVLPSLDAWWVQPLVVAVSYFNPAFWGFGYKFYIITMDFNTRNEYYTVRPKPRRCPESGMRFFGFNI